MSFVAAIFLVSVTLLLFWGGSRELRKALTEVKTIARLRQSGVLQPGTILKIEVKRFPPTEYREVIFQYKENKTTYRGKHRMSSVSAKRLMKEDQEKSIRFLPGHPQSARVDGFLTDSFETKRALIMGCALLACFVLVMCAVGVGFVLGWRVETVEVFAFLVFSLSIFLSMPVAWLALRFLLG